MANSQSSAENTVVTFLRKRDYQFLRELGSGACGKTVLLHDDLIDELFVCKKYSPVSEDMRSALYENFVREIKLLHQLHHPNVVRVFNYYLFPDLFSGYILMEFVDGEDIQDHVANNPETINELFLQAVAGFEHLQNSKVLHRDIRPGNILVTSQGVLKIIDLGFGKSASNSHDFDKSVSLNWWCDIPEDFDYDRYDYATEVYFVGKLFERLIQQNKLSHFQHTELLRNMCLHDPGHRIASFSQVARQIRSKKFPELSFGYSDLSSYRTFADHLCTQITKIENGTKYQGDLETIRRELSDVHRSFMLEELVPDARAVVRIFLDGAYYYRKAGLPVKSIKEFVALLRTCTEEQGRIVLANLHTRFDAIERYSSKYEDDIPF